MPVFAVHDSSPKFIFIINYKVMYSSLHEILPIHFPKVKFHGKKSASKINFYDFPIYSIVRNPFSRVVSTFYEKCSKSPELKLDQKSVQLQNCQYQLLEILQKVRNKSHNIADPANLLTLTENPEERTLLNENFKILMSISFEEYVECLGLLFKSKKVDGHFQKQYNAFSIPRQNPFYFRSKVFRNTQIFKIENLDKEWQRLCDQLKKKMDLIQKNRTDDTRSSVKSFYTEQTRKKITELYMVDFKNFDYPLYI